LPPSLQRFARVPGLEAVVLGSRLLFSVRSINAQDMPERRGVVWLACAGLVAGFTALDATGACLKRLGLVDAEHASVVALGYHEDVDGLTAADGSATGADPGVNGSSRRAA